MKLKINKRKKMKKVKIIKTSIILCASFPFILSGCDNVNTSDYYLVHNNDKYYICTKTGKYVNSCDHDFKSVIDDSVVGSICENKDNFDYQIHRLSTDFLSELQVANLSDVIDEQVKSYRDIVKFAQSDTLNDIGDRYFKNKKYYFEYDFDSYLSSSLKIYKLENGIILGYDMSPKRLSGTNDYVYSIIDNDVIKLSGNDINIYNISDYFGEDNYISYTTVQDLSANKKLEKVLEK